MIVLPLAYLGSVHYFTKLCFEPCVVDVHEHWVKQSLRNRSRILSATGVTPLTVHVVKTPNEDKCPVRDVRIDYSKRWRHVHWASLVAAYKASPYFDHYADRFAPFYERRYEFLFDLNRELTLLLLELLGSRAQLQFSDSYISPAAAGSGDWRHGFSEKPRLHRPDPHFRPIPYYQVFAPAGGFVPDLSAVDLLFCEGPYALECLRGSVAEDLFQ